jgi:uncharacterized protein (TIGR03437 family)
VTIAERGIGVFGYPRTASDYDPIVIHLDASLVTPQNPAKAGEFLLVFLTGVGPIDGYPQSGKPVALSPLPATLTSAQVTLAGAPVQALYLGMTPGFIGLAQLNIKMPDTLPAGNKLALKVQEGASSHTVNLYVQQ